MIVDLLASPAVAGFSVSKIRGQGPTILGYLSTAAKHGIDKITALRHALTGQPWMPALPTPA
jgi:hypothetical protein